MIVSNIGKRVNFFEYVVLSVEEVSTEAAGVDKLEAAAIIIDELLELPMLLELIDRYIIKTLISIVVYYLNEQYGHIWSEVVK